MVTVTTYASNKNTSWTTFPQSSVHVNSIFLAYTSSFAPTFAATMFKNAQSICGKVIHMISIFFDQPQFSIGGHICISCIAWDHTQLKH